MNWKQALNALAFFFKQVCGVAEPVFQVKLRKTGTRVPVVLSKREAQVVFEKLKSPGGRYELAARPLPANRLAAASTPAAPSREKVAPPPQISLPPPP